MHPLSQDPALWHLKQRAKSYGKDLLSSAELSWERAWRSYQMEGFLHLEASHDEAGLKAGLRARLILEETLSGFHPWWAFALSGPALAASLHWFEPIELADFHQGGILLCIQLGPLKTGQTHSIRPLGSPPSTLWRIHWEGQSAQLSCRLPRPDLSWPLSTEQPSQLAPPPMEERQQRKLQAADLLGLQRLSQLFWTARILGLTAASLRDLIRHTEGRRSFGRPMIAHQEVGFRLGDFAVRLHGLQLMLYEEARRMDLRMREEPHWPAACLLGALRLGHAVTQRACQLYGAGGLSTDTVPYQRFHWMRQIAHYLPSQAALAPAAMASDTPLMPHEWLL